MSNRVKPKSNAALAAAVSTLALSLGISPASASEPPVPSGNPGEMIGPNQTTSTQQKSEQFKSEQFKSGQFKSGQFKSGQFKSQQFKSEQLKSQQLKSEQLKSSQPQN